MPKFLKIDTWDTMVLMLQKELAKKIIGKKSKEIPNILGYEGRDEIIHKDDLVKIF